MSCGAAAVETVQQTGNASASLGGNVDYQRCCSAASYHLDLNGGRLLHLGLTHGFHSPWEAPTINCHSINDLSPAAKTPCAVSKRARHRRWMKTGRQLGAETYTQANLEFEQLITRKWSVVTFFDAVGFAQHRADYTWDTGLYSAGGGLCGAASSGRCGSNMATTQPTPPRPGRDAAFLHRVSVLSLPVFTAKLLSRLGPRGGFSWLCSSQRCGNTMAQMKTVHHPRRTRAIAACAYQLWEEAGRPTGREEEFGCALNDDCKLKLFPLLCRPCRRRPFRKRPRTPFLRSSAKRCKWSPGSLACTFPETPPPLNRNAWCDLPLACRSVAGVC